MHHFGGSSKTMDAPEGQIRSVSIRVNLTGAISVTDGHHTLPLGLQNIPPGFFKPPRLSSPVLSRRMRLHPQKKFVEYVLRREVTCTTLVQDARVRLEADE